MAPARGQEAGGGGGGHVGRQDGNAVGPVSHRGQPRQPATQPTCQRVRHEHARALHPLHRRHARRHQPPAAAPVGGGHRHHVADTQLRGQHIGPRRRAGQRRLGCAQRALAAPCKQVVAGGDCRQRGRRGPRCRAGAPTPGMLAGERVMQVVGAASGGGRLAPPSPPHPALAGPAPHTRAPVRLRAASVATRKNWAACCGRRDVNMYTGLHCSAPLARSTASTSSPSASCASGLGPPRVATLALPGKHDARPPDTHAHLLLPSLSHVNSIWPAARRAGECGQRHAAGCIRLPPLTHGGGSGRNACGTRGAAVGGALTIAVVLVAQLLRRITLNLYGVVGAAAAGRSAKAAGVGSRGAAVGAQARGGAALAGDVGAATAGASLRLERTPCLVHHGMQQQRWRHREGAARPALTCCCRLTTTTAPVPACRQPPPGTPPGTRTTEVRRCVGVAPCCCCCCWLCARGAAPPDANGVEQLPRAETSSSPPCVATAWRR